MDSPYRSCKLTRCTCCCARPDLAARFVILIDELYEAKTRLVIQASHGLQLQSVWVVPTAAVR